MPLSTFLRNCRKNVANTSRVNLFQSTEIVRCCRIIIQKVYSPEFVDNENFGLVQSVLIQVEEALKAVNTSVKQSDACMAFEQATIFILKASKILQLDGPKDVLGDIEIRLKDAKTKDGHAEQTSSRLRKHLERLTCSSTEKSHRIGIDIRMRRHISDEREQRIFEVRGKATDTLDIVLLYMKLSYGLRQNLRFYDRTFPDAIKDLVYQRNDRLDPLPFDCVLSEIPRLTKSLVLYCLYDHESGNYIVLRCQSPRLFTNLWEITLNSTFVLQDVFGIIRRAETSIDVSHAEVRITKKQVSSESVREEMQGAWPELLREIHKSFGTASNICWTIEAPHSPRIPSKPWVSQSNESSSTLVSITPTPVALRPPTTYQEKKGKPGRSSWFTALVAKFNG